MAMSPQDSRVLVLGTAIREATFVLKAPVDKIIVDDKGKITLWAGKRRVTTRPRFNQSYRNGEPTLGGGSWETVMGPIETDPET